MFKKFMAFFLATIVLLAAVGFMYLKYIKPSEYPVFIESFSHGVMTVDNLQTSGSDSKFSVNCKAGETITVNINPERTEKNYYNLSKLVVNGENVTDEVKMLQYKTKVREKLSIVAYFEKGEKEASETQSTTYKYNKPHVLMPANTPYIGSENAYDFEDPSIIYDDESEYYYCFGSGNVAARSRDLINWENRTNYFPVPENCDNSRVMNFKEFISVSKWANAHGYDSDLSLSSPDNNREPLAPDIVKIGSYYYLYFSLSKSQDANESAIFCVRTTNLEYSFENKDWQDVGLVISSCGRNSGTDTENPKSYYDKANAVHPSVFQDEDGGLFMVYGSYFGEDKINNGIYLLELNSKTGLLSQNDACNSQGEEISTLHGKSRFMSGVTLVTSSKALNKGVPVSACDVVFDKASGYYYLFVTYGNTQTNYSIKVARSKNVAGPYVDYNGRALNKTSFFKNDKNLSKGLKLVGGYNFLMSSQGGVSYSNVGKASTGSPSIIKTSDGKWLMALQSRIYYKVGDEIFTGERKFSKEDNVNADMKSALEIRQIFFDKDNWPIALPETFSGEKANKSIKPEEMNGNWDVIVFKNSASPADNTTIERNISEPVTIIGNIAISKNNISNGEKLSKLKFTKKDKISYEMLLDNVLYTIYPTVMWDWELDEAALVFSGIGEDGCTIWGKKNYSAFTGIYTDAFEYLLSFADSSVQSEYKKKMNDISNNPSQTQIDKMTKEVADIVLNQ